MKNPINTLMPVIGLLIFAPSILKAEEKVVKTELLAVCLEGFVPGYFYQNGKNVAKIKAFNQAISPPVAYEGSADLKFFKEKDGAKAATQGQSSEDPITSVTLPEDCNRVLLVFDFSNDEEFPVLTAYGVKNSEFGAGDYRIFNFSKDTIHVALNDKESSVEVAPGEQQTVQAAAWDAETQSFQATFSLDADASVKPVYSSVWGHRPERRSFIFVTGGSGEDKPLKITKFYDVPSVKAMQ